MEDLRKLKVKCVDSLEKVFPDSEPTERYENITGLWNETVSFQVAYHLEAPRHIHGRVAVETALPYRIRKVSLVPVNYPCHKKRDHKYLRTTPGLYPDLLEDINHDDIIFVPDQWKSIWIDMKLNEEIAAGKYSVNVLLFDEQGELLGKAETLVMVIDKRIPELPIKHTEWFYADCLADFYQVEVFSQEHWKIIENFMKTAVKRKCNMILTPIFTPPLDTAVGGERTTVQLVRISINDGRYSFDFSDLEHWVRLAKQAGFTYFEMSHLFTQWGVKAAPKIMATVNGVYQRIFGWDTPATGGSYEEFLRIFLPKLTKELEKLHIADKTYFHISDEPHGDMAEDYKKAKDVVAPYLEGFHMIDALSDFTFYETGLVEQPVCAINAIEPFLNHNVKNLWSYYCTAQCVDVSNRFMALPSFRNRIYGIQVYLYQISGVLHWGYNFYNSDESRKHLNPYQVTDCEYAVPSGDGFLVYPGPDGMPEESIRIMVHYEAMEDICAMYLLETMSDRQTVLNIIEEEAGMKITFSEYPQDPSFCIRVRNRINEQIYELCSRR